MFLLHFTLTKQIRHRCPIRCRERGSLRVRPRGCRSPPAGTAGESQEPPVVPPQQTTSPLSCHPPPPCSIKSCFFWILFTRPCMEPLQCARHSAGQTGPGESTAPNAPSPSRPPMSSTGLLLSTNLVPNTGARLCLAGKGCCWSQPAVEA